MSLKALVGQKFKRKGHENEEVCITEQWPKTFSVRQSPQPQADFVSLLRRARRILGTVISAGFTVMIPGRQPK
jgi:hypothetical protein